MNKIRITILTGPYEGNSYEFEYDITIGRDINNDLAFPLDLTTSRKHAKLTFNNKNLFLTDLASTNGTFIIIKNKMEKIQPNKDINLTLPCIVKIGNTTMLISY